MQKLRTAIQCLEETQKAQKCKMSRYKYNTHFQITENTLKGSTKILDFIRGGVIVLVSFCQR